MNNITLHNRISHSVVLGAALALETLLFSTAFGQNAWYRATVLPRPAPVQSSNQFLEGRRLSNLPLVVGNFGNRDQGFLWLPGLGSHSLRDLVGWQKSIVEDVSDHAIVGAFSTRGEAYHPFLLTFGREVQVLPKLIEDPRLAAGAMAVSANGIAAGWCEIEPASGTFGGPTHAVVWKDGVVTDIGTLEGGVSGATDVNSAGVVVGNSSSPLGQVGSAFRWEAHRGIERLQRVQDNGGTFAYAISEPGVIVGAVDTVVGDRGSFHTAATWSLDNQVSMLPYVFPTPGQFGLKKYSEAVGINRYGEIVGQEVNEADRLFHAVLWIDRQGYALENVVEGLPPGVRLNAAVDINDNGEILVNGFNTVTTQFVTILLTPLVTPLNPSAPQPTVGPGDPSTVK